MSYNSKRISEQLRVLRPAIDDFIVRYNAWNGPAGGGPRQTVFLFPGGMASRLVRATRSYPPATDDDVLDYEDVWLTPLTFFGGARDLRMKKAGPATGCMIAHSARCISKVSGKPCRHSETEIGAETETKRREQHH